MMYFNTEHHASLSITTKKKCGVTHLLPEPKQGVGQPAALIPVLLRHSARGNDFLRANQLVVQVVLRDWAKNNKDAKQYSTFRAVLYMALFPNFPNFQNPTPDLQY